MLRSAIEIAFALLGSLLLASTALAHPVAIVTGHASLDAGVLSIEISRDGDGLDHLGLDPADPEAPRALRGMIAAGLVVVDDRGERILPNGALSDDGCFEYPLPRAAAAAVSLWIDPGSMLARRGVQLHLGRTDGSRTVRLTPGGNAATMLAEAHPVSGSAVESWRRQRRFDRMHAIVDGSGERLRIDIVAPVSIVETWIPLPRETRYALTPELAAPGLESFAGLIRDAVTIGGAAPSIESVRLLRPGEGFEGDTSSPEPVSAAGACVLVRLAGPAADRETEVEWLLFNAVIRRVEFIATSAPFVEQSATPYSPVTHWAIDGRGASPP